MCFRYRSQKATINPLEAETSSNYKSDFQEHYDFTESVNSVELTKTAYLESDLSTALDLKQTTTLSEFERELSTASDLKQRTSVDTYTTLTSTDGEVSTPLVTSQLMTNGTQMSTIATTDLHQSTASDAEFAPHPSEMVTHQTSDSFQTPSDRIINAINIFVTKTSIIRPITYASEVTHTIVNKQKYAV